MRLYALELTTETDTASDLVEVIQSKSRDYLTKYCPDPKVIPLQNGDVSLWTITGTMDKFNDQLQIQVARSGNAVSWRADLRSTTDDLRPQNWVPKHLSLTNDVVRQADWANKTGEVRDDARDVPPHLCSDFGRMIMEQSRRVPVVVVTKHNEFGDFIVDPDVLAEKLVGLAHVYLLDEKQATYNLTESLPHKMGVFDGGVRVYWPGVSMRSELKDHPLFTGAQLIDLGEQGSLDAVRGTLIQRMKSLYSTSQLAEKVRLELGREASKTLNSVADLKARIRELEATNQTLLETIDGYQEQLETLTSMMARAKPGEALHPEDLHHVHEVVALAEAQLPNLVFTPKAKKGGQNYQTPHTVGLYDVFEALHDFADERQSGYKGPVEEFFTEWGRRNGRKLPKYTPHESTTTMGKHGKDRQAKYNGELVTFTRHFTIGIKGKGCVHMHWELIDNKIVFGHVGPHLDNS